MAATENPLPLGKPPPWTRARAAQEYRRLQSNTNPKAHFKFYRHQWREVARATPLIREPAENRCGLVQADLIGHCLEPIFPVGTRCWFDLNVPAQHGDFVIFEMDPALIEYLSSDPIALRENGGPPKTSVMIKRLVWLDDWFLLAKDSGGPIRVQAPHRHRVLGVLRDFEIGGARGDAPQAQAAYMAILSRGADTIELASIHEAGPIVESDSTSTPSAADIASVTVTLDHADDAVEVNVSGRMVIDQTAGAIPYQEVLLGCAATDVPGTGMTDQFVDSFLIEGEEGTFNFALVGNFTAYSGAGDYEFGLRLGMAPGGTGITIECTFTDVNVSVKRTTPP